jgi:hypothetical protein
MLGFIAWEQKRRRIVKTLRLAIISAIAALGIAAMATAASAVHTKKEPFAHGGVSTVIAKLEARDVMADNESQKSSTGMAFVVGGLVVAVLVIGYFVLGGQMPGSKNVDVDISVPAPSAPVEATPPSNSGQPAQPPASGSTTQ